MCARNHKLGTTVLVASDIPSWSYFGTILKNHPDPITVSFSSSARTERPTWKLQVTRPCPLPTCRMLSASSKRYRNATRHERLKRRRKKASSSRTRWSSTSTAATLSSKTFTSGPTSPRRGCKAHSRHILMVRIQMGPYGNLMSKHFFFVPTQKASSFALNRFPFHLSPWRQSWHSLQ